MTREEAIKLLVNATYSDEWQGNEDLTTAHNMAIKALETLEEFEKAHIITGGRLNGRTYAYKCGLEDGKRKALEQEPCEDAVSRQALIERINNAEENFKADNMESIASDDGNPFVDGVLSGVFNIREMVAQAPSVTPTACIAKVTFDKDELKKIVDEKVKELPVTQKWIPVSERLPEEKGFYLVSVKNEHDRRYTKSCWFYGNGKWFARQEVVAWMPLPEPYKEEMESEE